jgi:hypothetical protein
MDHYSLELLARLHKKELVEERLREQAIQRQNPGRRRSNRFRQNLLTILSLILSIYWLFA